MKRVLVVAGLLAVALVPQTAQAHEETLHECTVDVGSPFLLYDQDGGGNEGRTVGGCVLVERVQNRSRMMLGGNHAASGPLALLFEDCVFQYDHDRDGEDYRTIEPRDLVPKGAIVWANCLDGHDLYNRLHLHPVDRR